MSVRIGLIWVWVFIWDCEYVAIDFQVPFLALTKFLDLSNLPPELGDQAKSV